MKKVFALILAVLYMTASSGVVLNVHYCMGKVSSVKVDNFSHAACKCGKKETNNSCCQTTLKVVKLSNDHKASLASVDLKVPVAVIATVHSVSENLLTEDEEIVLPSINGPPLYLGNKIYIKNCVFRI